MTAVPANQAEGASWTWSIRTESEQVTGQPWARTKATMFPGPRPQTPPAVVSDST